MKSKNSSTNQIKESLVATLQALVGREDLQVEFEGEVKNNFFSWDQDLVVSEKKVRLPEIVLQSLLKNRAAPDLAACYLLSHDKKIHQKNRNSEEQKFFDEFEKIRVIASVKNSYAGVVKNILHKVESDIFSGSTSPSLILLQEIFGKEILPRTREVAAELEVSFNRKKFLVSSPVILDPQGRGSQEFGSKKAKTQEILGRSAPKDDVTGGGKDGVIGVGEDDVTGWGKDDGLGKVSNDGVVVKEIKNLAQLIHNQSKFELGVAKVLELLRSEENSQDQNQNEEKSAEKPNSEKQKPKDDLNNSGPENVESEPEKNFSQSEEDASSRPEENHKIADFKEDEKDGDTVVRLDQSGSHENKIEFKNPYKFFTSKFDEVIFPQKLISKNELELLRDQLDLKLGKLSGISKKMSLKLKRKLLSKQNSLQERDASRGVLDRKKLTRLIIDPSAEDIWITHKTHEYQDTCLTILLDNSGSMRGNPIVMSALACEIIAEILEKYSVKTEIIGFTTADWKGGKARKLWESSGRPHNPGRLNELRHIIYKHFNQSLKKSKVNLGLMLKEGILKENIDGEALLFARSRLMQQNEKRKILMVISDGTPVDDSTTSANDSDILSDHLRHVISKIEKQSKVEIVGVGIGHSTDDFYRNSIAIRSLEELGDVMIEKIAELL